MSRYRVFATCNIGDAALQKLRDRGLDVEVYDEMGPPPKSLIVEKVASGIDALVTTLRDEIDTDVFEAGRGTLKVVAQDAVGFDNIDRGAANRARVPFTNTPGVLADTTAEFALFMMGALARKLPASEALVRSQGWCTWHPSLPFLGHEVFGTTVGVVGTGRIGRAFVRRCVGLNVDLVCHTRTPDEAFADGVQELLDAQYRLRMIPTRRTIRYVSLDEVLDTSDFISLHVPLTDETRHLIGERALRRMRPEAFLINTARGPVVDEVALVHALERGWIAGAALDVFEEEPLPADSPLRGEGLKDRLRLYHHFASAGTRTRLSPDPNVGMAGRCVQGVLDVLFEDDPDRMPFVVNRELFADRT